MADPLDFFSNPEGGQSRRQYSLAAEEDILRLRRQIAMQRQAERLTLASARAMLKSLSHSEHSSGVVSE